MKPIALAILMCLMIASQALPCSLGMPKHEELCSPKKIWCITWDPESKDRFESLYVKQVTQQLSPSQPKRVVFKQQHTELDNLDRRPQWISDEGWRVEQNGFELKVYNPPHQFKYTFQANQVMPQYYLNYALQVGKRPGSMCSKPFQDYPWIYWGGFFNGVDFLSKYIVLNVLSETALKSLGTSQIYDLDFDPDLPDCYQLRRIPLDRNTGKVLVPYAQAPLKTICRRLKSIESQAVSP